jgi:hypothetical protein
MILLLDMAQLLHSPNIRCTKRSSLQMSHCHVEFWLSEGYSAPFNSQLFLFKQIHWSLLSSAVDIERYGRLWANVRCADMVKFSVGSSSSSISSTKNGQYVLYIYTHICILRIYIYISYIKFKRNCGFKQECLDQICGLPSDEKMGLLCLNRSKKLTFLLKVTWCLNQSLGDL